MVIRFVLVFALCGVDVVAYRAQLLPVTVHEAGRSVFLDSHVERLSGIRMGYLTGFLSHAGDTVSG